MEGCSSILNQGCSPCPGSYAARVAIDRWRKHFLPHKLSPSACSGHFDQPPKGSAVQESPTSNVLESRRNGKLNKGCTAHKGFNSDCMESCRQEDFPKASAVAKSEFRNFFNHGVTEVNTLKQSITVTSVRSYGYKVLWEMDELSSSFCRRLFAVIVRGKTARWWSFGLRAWVFGLGWFWGLRSFLHHLSVLPFLQR